MERRFKGLSRRAFNKLCSKSVLGVAAFMSGCAKWTPKGDSDNSASRLCDAVAIKSEYEYIVVGSGAGGGPLAANLARKGFKVLLLEAGGDDEDYNYQVPVFHPLSTEDPTLRWDFFVRHYDEDAKSRIDPKFEEAQKGIYYPRAGTLGGCTAHNAMIMVYPHNSDWEYIAKLTGDDSWNPENMRRYYQRLERCQYVSDSEENPSRHGFKGWLTTNIPSKDVISKVIKDKELRKLLLKSVLTDLKDRNVSFIELVKGILSDGIIGKIDPNDWRWVKRSGVGFCLTPLTTLKGRRAGTREYIKNVSFRCKGNLTVKLHALATRVVLDDSHRATGVEFLEGQNLYRADRDQSRVGGPGKKHVIRASREVILSGGAFNTPQLLMLSGIGPNAELRKHNIDVNVDLPGVGENLQDRYEVGVISEMASDFSALKGASFMGPPPGELSDDPLFNEWVQSKGLYTTNGAVVSFIKKSAPERPEPDLYVFGLAGYFKGYFLGYSKRVTEDQDFFTWAILKAHTRNNAGVVRLNSNDPQDVPYINFRYFDEGNDASGEDLASVVEGVKFVRAINRRAEKFIKQEVEPGNSVQSDQELEEFVKYNAWGHHASCSCKIGPKSDRTAVVDSRFRVHGVTGLRIVDASVFPKIPGFFIVSAIYMISEKASDVIIADALKQKTKTAKKHMGY